MLGWLAGLATAVLTAGGVALFLLFGGYDVAATSGHPKPVAEVIHTTMIHSIRQRAEPASPAKFDMPTLLTGMREYEAHCMACHGGPGIDRARWASAMLPTPPFLLGASQHWTRGELVKIVDGGVKMTGMPAWGEVLPRDRVLSVVTLLQAMPRLTPAQFGALRGRAAAQGASPAKPVALED